MTALDRCRHQRDEQTMVESKKGKYEGEEKSKEESKEEGKEDGPPLLWRQYN